MPDSMAFEQHVYTAVSAVGLGWGWGWGGRHALAIPSISLGTPALLLTLYLHVNLPQNSFTHTRLHPWGEGRPEGYMPDGGCQDMAPTKSD